jgi:hypothetical protein
MNIREAGIGVSGAFGMWGHIGFHFDALPFGVFWYSVWI